MIFALFDTILTCDQIMLRKRTEGPPLRQGMQSPTMFSGTLNSCSRWCADDPECYAVSWEKGSCVPAGPFHYEAFVSSAVYIVPSNYIVPGK